MENALHESIVKLEGRWKIIHDPDMSIGPVPARGLLSKRRPIAPSFPLPVVQPPPAKRKPPSWFSNPIQLTSASYPMTYIYG